METRFKTSQPNWNDNTARFEPQSDFEQNKMVMENSFEGNFTIVEKVGEFCQNFVW